MLADPSGWEDLPAEVGDWLRLQRGRSVVPEAGQLLVEIFPRGGKVFLVAYCFEGRNVHQTLGVLLTRRMERAGLGPLGFVATDYVLATWSVRAPASDDEVAALFDQDMLGDDLEAWMDESSVMKRTFRTVAVIAGLIERRHPGQEKTGRQVTVNSDLIYNVLRRYEPRHVLLRATREDAARGLADLGRLAAMLARIQGRIAVRRLRRVSPLAVPVLLEIGREQVSRRGRRRTARSCRPRPDRRGDGGGCGRAGAAGQAGAGMSQARFSFCGVELVACPSGGLYIPAFGTLAAADLHLEKGSACARRGRLLPPYDSRATLAALADAIARFAAEPGRLPRRQLP